jgi:hypothetical protein
MSMLNIVIHMLFASIDVLAVKRDKEDKITLRCQQEKSAISILINIPINCRCA